MSTALDHFAVTEQRRCTARPVHLVLAGATGRVGRALRAQLARQQRSIRDELGLELRLVAAVNSRVSAWAEQGLALPEVDSRLAAGAPTDWATLSRRLRGQALERPVLVDCTASPGVAARYAELLDAGVAVVTPNKIANAGRLHDYRRLRSIARARGVPYRYETTVGAALPVLRTIEELCRSGDRVRRISAVLSGTLSFVLGRVGEGVAFSIAVREAHALGYTEPHPREDLSGEDVARKLLITLRESGYALEREDLEVAPLVPASFGEDLAAEAYLEALAALDEAWAARAEAARGAGCRLVYLARFDGLAAQVAVSEVDADDRLARLTGTENIVVVETDRYRLVPLSVAGPGAGPEVTAAGVLADIIDAARQTWPT